MVTGEVLWWGKVDADGGCLRGVGGGGGGEVRGRRGLGGDGGCVGVFWCREVDGGWGVFGIG